MSMHFFLFIVLTAAMMHMESPGEVEMQDALPINDARSGEP